MELTRSKKMTVNLKSQYEQHCQWTDCLKHLVGLKLDMDYNFFRGFIEKFADEMIQKRLEEKESSDEYSSLNTF